MHPPAKPTTAHPPIIFAAATKIGINATPPFTSARSSAPLISEKKFEFFSL